MERIIIIASSSNCVRTMFSDQFHIKEVMRKWRLKDDVHFTEVLKVQAWVMGRLIVNLIALVQLVMERSNIVENSTSSNDISWKEAG